MKVIELMKIGKNMLEVLHSSCIKVSHVKYIALYEEYLEMVARKEKMSYIAAVLSGKYGISERQFFYIIKHFNQDCKFPAS